MGAQFTGIDLGAKRRLAAYESSFCLRELWRDQYDPADY
jgi:hypothetical protein